MPLSNEPKAANPENIFFYSVNSVDPSFASEKNSGSLRMTEEGVE
jgi:hypothetical protein